MSGGTADPWQVITDVRSELLHGGQTAAIRCHAALGVLARAGIDFDGGPVKAALAAQQPADAAAEPEPRYALVEQMGYRQVTGTVREVTFCGRQMLEVTDLATGRTGLAAPESLYALTWLTEAEARARVTPRAVPAALPAGDPDPWDGDPLGDDDEDEL